MQRRIDRQRRRLFVAWLVSTVLAAVGCSSGESGESTAQDQEALWRLLSTQGSFVESYASIADMSASADLVVVGSVVRIGVGREWGERTELEGDENVVASVLIEVEVSEVLRGSLPDPGVKSITWEESLAAYSAPRLAAVIRSDGIIVGDDGRIAPEGGGFAVLPQGRGVFFLRLRTDMGTEITPAPHGSSFVGGVSYRLVTPQGVVVESSKGATTPLAYAYLDLDDSGYPSETSSAEGKLAAEIADLDLDGVIARARA